MGWLTMLIKNVCLKIRQVKFLMSLNSVRRFTQEIQLLFDIGKFTLA